MIKAFIIGERNWDEWLENDFVLNGGNLASGGTVFSNGTLWAQSEGTSVGSVGAAMWVSENNPNNTFSNTIFFSAALNISTLSEFKSNSDARASGLSMGDVYRNGDQLCVVHS